MPNVCFEEAREGLQRLGHLAPLNGRADGYQKSGHMVYSLSFPVILPVCRSIRPRIVL